MARTSQKRLVLTRRRGAVLAFFGFLVWTLTSCVSSVRPPENVVDPVPVFVLKNSMHRAVMLPSEQGYVEFGFGEWAWYAENRTAWYRTIPAMLWPTAGAFGRRETFRKDGGGLRRMYYFARLERILVERELATALLERLEQRFARGSDEAVLNETLRLTFVPDENDYSCLYNCNDAVADWLVELGCDVSTAWLRTEVEVVAPDD